MGNKWDWESKVEFWDNVHGFKMNCMKEDIFREAHVQLVDPYSTISSSDVVKVRVKTPTPTNYCLCGIIIIIIFVCLFVCLFLLLQRIIGSGHRVIVTRCTSTSHRSLTWLQ